ncbi:hypothetical protein PQX77_002430 [Marasmius sp. AFHP31]|nr:hypothetical protein PQX77_002430 [Marasmius sp. AFHP31]
MPRLPQLPIDTYYHLLSPDIATADLPLPPNGQVIHVFPKKTAGVEKYFSRLPPLQLGIGYVGGKERAKGEEWWEPRPVDNAWSMPDDAAAKDIYLVVSSERTPGDRHFSIRWIVRNRHNTPGKFTLEERCHLEAIAWNVPVLLPLDGSYGTRNWIACVLGVACARGLMEVEVVRGALEMAMAEILPVSYGPFRRVSEPDSDNSEP